MQLRAIAAVLTALAAVSAPVTASAECVFAKLGEMKVDSTANLITVEVEVNGVKKKMRVNTGSSFSRVTEAGAAIFGATGNPTSPSARVFTTSGERAVAVAHLTNVTIGSAFRVPYLEVFVGGKGAEDDEVVGELGQDIFAGSDVEFDLAGNRIAFYDPKGCGNADLIYWSTSYSLANLRLSSDRFFGTTVELNGKKFDAQIITSMSYSAVDLTAARAAGVTPQTPGVVPLGRDVVTPREAWIGLFETAAIGDEQLRNVRLAFSDLWSGGRASETGSRIGKQVLGFPSMTLGLDFLRAHRVLLATSQGRMYMTYNGGGIFKTPAVPTAALPPR